MQIPAVKAIITGAASGIGRCFALELARAGASVVGGDVDEDGLRSLATEAAEARVPPGEWRGEVSAGRLSTATVDVSREDQVKAFVGLATERLGGVNTLVNNAGILRDGLLVTREENWVRKLPTAQWKAVLDTNLTGPYLMAREVAEQMLLRQIRPALIVNISSVTREGNPGQSNYAASKAGLDAQTRTWGLELAPHGIRVGGIAPGLVDTPMLRSMEAEQRRRLTGKVPLGRTGRPEEIWLALRFIIECDYFTGRVIDVDGGAAFA